MMTRYVVVLLSFVLGLMLASPAFAQSCAQVRADLVDAQKSGDLDAIERLVAQSGKASAACEDQARACLPRSAASSLVAAARAAAAQGAKVEEVEALLDRAGALAPIWQVLVQEADLQNAAAVAAHDPKLYTQASKLYEKALTEIREAPDCAGYAGAGVPGAESLKRISAKADTARMLASEWVVVANREGECGGAFEVNTRGFIDEPRPLPIQFDYDKASFTHEGQKRAEVLLECLQGHGFKSITLTGHTDAHGTDDYNFGLSAGRLNTVAQFLKAHGFSGAITVLPKGKTEPFKFADPEGHSPEEIDQANRRVELGISSQ